MDDESKEQQPNQPAEEGKPEETAEAAEAETPFSSSTEERAAKRKKGIVYASLAAALLVCLVLGGTGVALGWFSPDNALMQTTQDAVDSSAGKGQAAVDGQKTPSSSKKSEEGSGPSVEGDAASSDAPDGSGSSSGSDASGGAASAQSTDDASASGGSAGNEAVGSDNAAAAPEPAPGPVPEPAPQAPATITVSVYVDSSQAVSYGYPACLASTSVTLSPGASVFDALCATGVSVGGSSSYISSISGLAEFACGSGSGWLYYVNGASPGYGPGSYALHGGEAITWYYTLQI